jgi:hypothetical protein
MIDINTILTQALTTAVAEATKPLTERIAALEAQLAQAAPAPQIDAAAAADALNSQEWFWEKISRYITNYSDITVDELHNIKQRLVELEAHESNVYHYDKGAVESLIEEAIDAHLEQANHLDEDDVNSLVERGVDYHEENRTHGDEDDIEEMVQKMLNSASISISV